MKEEYKALIFAGIMVGLYVALASMQQPLLGATITLGGLTLIILQLAFVLSVILLPIPRSVKMQGLVAVLLFIVARNVFPATGNQLLGESPASFIIFIVLYTTAMILGLGAIREVSDE